MPTLRELRTQRGWSQQEVAQKAMLSLPVVNRMEMGKPVNKSSFLRVCAVFDVEPSEVTGVVISRR